MKLTMIVLTVLLLATGATAQTAVTVPLPAPAGPPPATFTQPVNVTTTQTVNDTVTINGTAYQRTGTLSVTVTGSLTLTPSSGSTGNPGTPPTFTFGGYRDNARNVVTTIVAGSTLLIEGTGFPPSGNTVTFGSTPAAILTQGATEIQVTVPAVVGAVSVIVNGTPDPYPLTVAAKSVDLPPPGDDPQPWLFIAGFADMDGNANPAQVQAGDAFMIRGHLFGPQSATSRVEVNRKPATILSWLDSLIVARTGPNDAAPNAAATVLVWQNPVQYHEAMAPFKIIAKTP